MVSNLNERHSIFERLNHPEREERQRMKERKMLILRNILNAIFMLLAAATMIGIWAFPEYTNQWYILGLIAVCIKIVEVMFRMPGMKKNKK
jgi:uncharacterized ion transporter superfamily protein YfcC